ncbi:MAG: hypothetical protein L6V80_01585 [Bacteroidales bacterium]|nr:MAG: hypothetical protein L6V80_01585 [Bacteroidales bacterium]
MENEKSIYQIMEERREAERLAKGERNSTLDPQERGVLEEVLQLGAACLTEGYRPR